MKNVFSEMTAAAGEAVNAENAVKKSVHSVEEQEKI